MKRYRVVEEQPAPHRMVVEPMIPALNPRDAVRRYAARWQHKAGEPALELPEGPERPEVITLHVNMRGRARGYRRRGV